MECLPLDIKIIKANDLKDVNMMSKMDVYAVVSISGDSRDKSKQKTPVDKDGGTSPKWNHSMKFTLDEAAAQQNKLTLKIKLISDRSFGDKEIGDVHVPIKELLDNSINGVSDSQKAENPEKTATYSVRTPSGKTKGVVEISYKFGEKYTAAAPPVQKKVDGPTMAYPSGYPGSSAGYPPAGGYPPAAGYPPAGGYPPAAGYPPAGGYPPAVASPMGSYPYPPPGGYQPPQQGYGYPHPPQYGYGYPPPQAGYGYGYPPAQQPHKSGMGAGTGMALGVGAGLLGGLVVGDMISDVGEMAAYDAGYDDGMGDGFDM